MLYEVITGVDGIVVPLPVEPDRLDGQIAGSITGFIQPDPETSYNFV